MAVFFPVSGWITGLLTGWGTDVAVPGYEVTVAQVFGWVLAGALVLVCLPAPRQMWELFKLNLLSRVLHWPLRRAPYGTGPLARVFRIRHGECRPPAIPGRRG